jgi:hypothetical protein
VNRGQFTLASRVDSSTKVISKQWSFAFLS